jgi:hypothetical protein
VERDRGICALCGVDTLALRREFLALDRAWRQDGAEVRRRRVAWLQAHGIPVARADGRWWDIDHIVPVVDGGGFCGLKNLQTLCIPCHVRKSGGALRQRRA